MRSYELAFSTIHELGFIQVMESVFNELGVACFTNKRVHLILQNWDTGMSIETVENECRKIRGLLLNKGINVWNSYYILCSDVDKIDDDMAFFIERNSVFLRKYVIRRKIDLNRVIFLDDISTKEINNPLQLTSELIEEDSIVNELLKEVKERKGHVKNLNRSEIKDLVASIL